MSPKLDLWFKFGSSMPAAIRSSRECCLPGAGKAPCARKVDPDPESALWLYTGCGEGAGERPATVELDTLEPRLMVVLEA